MNKNTLKLTTGAMFIAIFAVLLLINQQTAYMFQEVIMYVLPVPMVAFSVKYGWKSGVPVMVGMILISMLFGTPMTVFYAASEAFIGLAFGTCLNKKVDQTQTMLIVILLSAIVFLVDLLFVSYIVTGYSLAQEAQEMQEMMIQMLQVYNSNANPEVMEAIETMYTGDVIVRMLLIGSVAAGVMQGYLVYVISLWVLKRLRYPVEKAKSLFLYYPPKWLGGLCLLATIVYMQITAKPLQNDVQQAILQTIGIAGSYIAIFFGIMSVLLINKYIIKGKAFLGVVLVILTFLFLSPILPLFGVVYMVTDFHRRIVEEGKIF